VCEGATSPNVFPARSRLALIGFMSDLIVVVDACACDGNTM